MKHSFSVDFGVYSTFILSKKGKPDETINLFEKDDKSNLQDKSSPGKVIKMAISMFESFNQILN